MPATSKLRSGAQNECDSNAHEEARAGAFSRVFHEFAQRVLAAARVPLFAVKTSATEGRGRKRIYAAIAARLRQQVHRKPAHLRPSSAGHFGQKYRDYALSISRYLANDR